MADLFQQALGAGAVTAVSVLANGAQANGNGQIPSSGVPGTGNPVPSGANVYNATGPAVNGGASNSMSFQVPKGAAMWGWIAGGVLLVILVVGLLFRRK